MSLTCVGPLSAYGAGGAAASAPATTQPATQVTATSAVLNGVLSTTDKDSLWAFQYGKTTSYGGATKPTTIGATTASVSATVTGHGVLSVPVQCAGPTGTSCKGKLSLSARGRIGKTVVTVGCGSAKFTASAGQRKTVHIGLSGRCLTLLPKARGHKLSAALKVVFTTRQPTLRLPVTLLG